MVYDIPKKEKPIITTFEQVENDYGFPPVL